MCTVCGCSDGEARVEKREQQQHHEGHSHKHQSHQHTHTHSEGAQQHHYGQGPARAHAPGLDQTRMVQIEQDILSKNNRYATANRRLFAAKGMLVLNLVSSPGAGKTTLLTRTLTELADEFPLAVIEGDQETSHDAQRIRETGTPAIQINTGKGCHLDGHMVGQAVQALAPADGAVMFIENVGNLVCPAAFDLGEAHKVAILSVTEGEDKPIKYPDMFSAADLLLLNKIDLLPYLEFDVQRCLAYARQINPDIRIVQLSSSSGEGVQHWCEWIRLTRQARLIGRPSGKVEAAAESSSA